MTSIACGELKFSILIILLNVSKDSSCQLAITYFGVFMVH